MSKKKKRRWFASFELLLGYFSAFLDARHELRNGHVATTWSGTRALRNQLPLPPRRKVRADSVSRYHRRFNPSELQQFASRKVRCWLPRVAIQIGRIADHVHPSALDANLITELRRVRANILMYVTSDYHGLEDGREIEYQFSKLLDQLESLPTVFFEMPNPITAAQASVLQETPLKMTEPKMETDEIPPPAARKRDVAHNANYMMVRWFGTEYTFTSNQASAVKALWEEWEATGLGLHQTTIGEAVDNQHTSFRMDAAFRKHPAFGTMITSGGKGSGLYKLAVPATGDLPTIKKR
jgi:hypothetical protein